MSAVYGQIRPQANLFTEFYVSGEGFSTRFWRRRWPSSSGIARPDVQPP